MNETDLRVVKTVRLIDQTLINLLKHESFEQITVQQICKQAQIGRSTFYHHYVDKFALLAHLNKIYADKFRAVMTKRIATIEQSTSLIELVTDLLPYKNELLLLFNIHTGTLSLDNDFRQIIADSLGGFLEERFTTKLPVDYLQQLYVANAMTYITWSLAYGLDDDVARFMNEAFINIANQVGQQGHN